MLGFFVGAGAKAPIQEHEYGDLYVRAVSSYIDPGQEQFPKSVLCSCVEYSKAVLGVYGRWGDARTIQPTHSEPQVGFVILFKNHVGVVTSVRDGYVYFREANYYPCKESFRSMKVGDPTIRGYAEKKAP